MPPRTPTVPVAIACSSRAIRVPRKDIARLAAFVAHAQGLPLADVDLAIVSARRIAALNRRWVGHHGPTDVISFDLADPGEPVSAQLIVCADVAVAQAAARGIPARRELLLYITHGLLHLLGHDDTTPKKAAAMHARQEELLDQFLTLRKPR